MSARFAWAATPLRLSLPVLRRIVALLLFSGVICTALAHWAMLVVNRSLPAVTTSLGLLATPAVGIASGSAFLGEAFDPALALIAGGIAFGIVSDRQLGAGKAGVRQ